MRFSLLPTALLAATAIAMPAEQQKQKGAGAAVDKKPFKTHKFEGVKFDPATMKATPKAKPATQQTTQQSSGNFSAAASNAGLAGCPQRVEWRRLSDSDRRAFVGAIKCLMNAKSKGGYPGAVSRWDDLASVHQRMTPQVHNTQRFLPWHRYYLAIFESLIRDECGYRGPMTWWDEAQDAGNFKNALVFKDQYFSPLPTEVNGQGFCITSGTFGNVQLAIGPQTSTGLHCLSRGVDESETGQCNQGFVDYVNSFGGFDDMEWWAERGPHAWGHNGIGPIMTDTYGSPGDPIFFMHHGFIDRNWYHWQNADPANRMYTLGSMAVSGSLTSLGIRGDVSVWDMMDTRGGFLCYEYDS